MFDFLTYKITPDGVSMLNKNASNVVALFVDKHTKANDRVVVATRRQ